MNDENIILFDWLSFTSKIDDVNSIVDFLGLYGLKFVPMYGMQGFRDRYYYEGISIHYNSSRFEGVWIEMSGQGCRTFETYSEKSFLDLFSYFIAFSDDYHVTRIDIAFDDHTGVIDLQKIVNDVDKQNFVSKFHADSITYTCSSGRRGYTIDIGSRKSDIKFRIYDKSFERKLDDGSHWVRFEIQLRNERAFNFIVELNNESVGNIFCGVITNYIRFVVPDIRDSNKRRWHTRKYWSDIVGNVSAISLYTPCNAEYNLARCENFVYNNCGNSIASIITIKGVENFLHDLYLNKPQTNAKYQLLINSNECVKSDPILEYLRKHGDLV